MTPGGWVGLLIAGTALMRVGLGWAVGLHGVFLTGALVLALTDRIAAARREKSTPSA